MATWFQSVGDSRKAGLPLDKCVGVKPWPRRFHDLRASRQTELADIVGEFVISQWIGNDIATGRKHYLRTNDEHFDRVLKTAVP